MKLLKNILYGVATPDIVGDGRRRLSEIFACVRKLLFRFVRQGLPNVNLILRFLHIYPTFSCTIDDLKRLHFR